MNVERNICTTVQQRGGVGLLLFCLFVCLFVWDRVSLCSPGYPGTQFVDRASLELIEIHLPLPPMLELKACTLPHPALPTPIVISVFCFLFFPELRTEPRALCLLSKHSTNELNPQPVISVFKKKIKSCLAILQLAVIPKEVLPLSVFPCFQSLGWGFSRSS